jgi:hypothetical protein
LNRAHPAQRPSTQVVAGSPGNLLKDKCPKMGQHFCSIFAPVSAVFHASRKRTGIILAAFLAVFLQETTKQNRGSHRLRECRFTATRGTWLHPGAHP